MPMDTASEGSADAPFSDAVRAEVNAALEDHLEHRDARSDARLRAVTDRICSEAHALDLSPEKMLSAIEAFYAVLPYPLTPADADRRRAFDTFVTRCIRAYFGSHPPRGGEDISAEVRMSASAPHADDARHSRER
jgi:hypothetical protein